MNTTNNQLAEAARAVIARWDSPKWKDEAPTAEYIGRLREALAAYEADPKPDAVITLTVSKDDPEDVNVNVNFCGGLNDDNAAHCLAATALRAISEANE